MQIRLKISAESKVQLRKISLGFKKSMPAASLVKNLFARQSEVSIVELYFPTLMAILHKSQKLWTTMPHTSLPNTQDWNLYSGATVFSCILMGKVFGAPLSPEEMEGTGVPVLLGSEDFWASRVRRYQEGR